MVEYGMQSGTIKDTFLDKNRDGENNVLLLKVELTDPDDMQTAQLITQAGEDNNPPKESRVVIFSIGNAWKVAIAVDDGIEPQVEQGERKIYSSDAGQIKAFIHFKKNGDIIINGDGDNAVRYSELETAFNQLKSDFDSLVSAYNSHIHTTTATVGPGPTPGVIAPTTSSGSPSTADITPAKIDNIKVPS